MKCGMLIAYNASIVRLNRIVRDATWQGWGRDGPRIGIKRYGIQKNALAPTVAPTVFANLAMPAAL
jgi:hypothetical protein